MKNLSIHPRSWPKDTLGIGEKRAKKDTSKPSKKTSRRQRRMLAKFDARQRAWASIPAADQPAFRKPGSRKMNQMVG